MSKKDKSTNWFEEDPIIETKEVVSKENKSKEENDKFTSSKAKYKYPFILHQAGRNLEIDHIFENDKEYTSEEIRSMLLRHQYYEYSGKVKFEYISDENVLLPIFQQHKKG